MSLTKSGNHDPSPLLNSVDHLLGKFDRAKSTLGTRSGPNVRWLKENEDDSKLVLPRRDLSNGMPTLARALMDFESGIACFLGQPNHGKTTLLVNMASQGLDQNDDLMIVDLSLDDPLKKRYVQYLACNTGLHYSTINVPQSASEEEKKRLGLADEKVRDWVRQGRLLPLEAMERMKIYRQGDGAERIEDLRRIDTRHFKTQLNLMSRLRDKFNDRSKKIAFMIDAWNNLDYTNAPGDGDLSQVNKMLDQIQEHADQEQVMVVLSAHARKTMNKKITMEDIKGTKNMEYNCVFGGIVRNELRENALLEPLVWEDSDGTEYPILTVEIGKTKVSSWDMPLFYVLKAGQCQLKPLARYEYETFLEMYEGQNRKAKNP